MYSNDAIARLLRSNYNGAMRSNVYTWRAVQSNHAAATNRTTAATMASSASAVRRATSLYRKRQSTGELRKI